VQLEEFRAPALAQNRGTARGQAPQRASGAPTSVAGCWADAVASARPARPSILSARHMRFICRSPTPRNSASSACFNRSKSHLIRSPQAISFADIVTSPFAIGPPLRPRSATQRGPFYLGQRGHLVLGSTCQRPQNGVCGRSPRPVGFASVWRRCRTHAGQSPPGFRARPHWLSDRLSVGMGEAALRATSVLESARPAVCAAGWIKAEACRKPLGCTSVRFGV
jgi:hypothetical protein